MTSMNQVFLMGNLTRDPEKRTTSGGQAVSELGLAVSDHYKDKEGKTVERTCFADIVVWGRAAENCAQFLKKGAPVLVEGRLQMDSWKTDAGEKRTKLRIRANRVQFLGKAGVAPRTTETASALEDNTESIPF